MARHFFDTSALVKRYHRESGSLAVDAVFNQPGARFSASRLAVVECVSAFCVRVRAGELAASDVPLMRKSLLGDVRRRVVLVPRLLVWHLSLADALLLRHAPTRRLRAADAIHLGVALDLLRRREIDTFVSCDLVQCEIASLEGLPTMNPLTAVP